MNYTFEYDENKYGPNGREVTVPINISFNPSRVLVKAKAVNRSDNMYIDDVMDSKYHNSKDFRPASGTIYGKDKHNYVIPFRNTLGLSIIGFNNKGITIRSYSSLRLLETVVTIQEIIAIE